MQPETCLSYWNQEIKTAMYNALFRSRSRYAAIPWPALFGINKPLNIPGTKGGTNWRERMPFKAVEACGMPQTAWLRTVIDESGRTPLQGAQGIQQTPLPEDHRQQRTLPETDADVAERQNIVAVPLAGTSPVVSKRARFRRKRALFSIRADVS